MKTLSWTLVLALLAGCASAPPIADAPVLSPAPYLAGEQIQRYMDVDVLWGGSIVETRQFERYAEIEVVAYPLDRLQRPALDAPEQGRFIALRAGQIDPREFSPGRFVTLRGPITGDRQRELRGESIRMAEVDARELVLWPWDYRFQQPRVSVSIGVSGRL
ncbi:Slp family lipoprotein [Pseudomarimonas salicorniae]|uniref:Slp family lipoprotein n=1 Tax=Pseudomarimonas salicorniae TaxID=2933270 RepID=A0ABT0GK42_9GAMM|nr:Slp family lipoprotein [Lysobacter sp. CAU 1642]MCK7594737.1 Slp family lipoprotein [Lysobacter sp. CAU 1642]